MPRKNKKDEIMTVGTNLPVPSFMAEDAQMGTEDLVKGIAPPFVKIVQKSANDELLDTHGVGAVVLMPQEDVLIPKPDEFPSEAELIINPLAFYIEFVRWAKVGSGGPPILDRTQDPTSELARLAKNPNTRKMEYKGQEVLNVEHLNFICRLIRPEGFEDQRVILSFFRGSYKTGSRLCTLIKKREAPIFGCQFSLRVDGFQSGEHTYKGFIVDNPEEEAWVTDEELYAENKKEHGQFMEMIKGGKIKSDYTQDADDADGDSQFG